MSERETKFGRVQRRENVPEREVAGVELFRVVQQENNDVEVCIRSHVRADRMSDGDIDRLGEQVKMSLKYLRAKQLAESGKLTQ